MPKYIQAITITCDQVSKPFNPLTQTYSVGSLREIILAQWAANPDDVVSGFLKTGELPPEAYNKNGKVKSVVRKDAERLCLDQFTKNLSHAISDIACPRRDEIVHPGDVARRVAALARLYIYGTRDERDSNDHFVDNTDPIREIDPLDLIHMYNKLKRMVRKENSCIACMVGDRYVTSPISISSFVLAQIIQNPSVSDNNWICHAATVALIELATAIRKHKVLPMLSRNPLRIHMGLSPGLYMAAREKKGTSIKFYKIEEEMHGYCRTEAGVSMLTCQCVDKTETGGSEKSVWITYGDREKGSFTVKAGVNCGRCFVCAYPALGQ